MQLPSRAAALVALLGIAMMMMVLGCSAWPSSASIRPPRFRRSLQQSASAPQMCQWVTEDGGSCPPAGCCYLSYEWIEARYPSAMGVLEFVFRPGGQEVCTKVFGPTSIMATKQADVDRCVALGRTNYCYVHYDTDAGQLSCRQPSLWVGGVDVLKSCPGSYWGDLAACTLTTRSACASTPYLKSTCTNIWPFIKSNIGTSSTVQDMTGIVKRLSATELQRLTNLTGGPDMPKLFVYGSCRDTRTWQGASNGNTELPLPSPISSYLSNFGSYSSSVARNYQRTNDTASLRGTNCSQLLKSSWVESTNDFCNELTGRVTDDSGSYLSLQGIAACLSAKDCELQWSTTPDGRPLALYCRMSNVRQLTVSMWSPITTEADMAGMLAGFEQCNQFVNRFNKTSCEATRGAVPTASS